MSSRGCSGACDGDNEAAAAEVFLLGKEGNEMAHTMFCVVMASMVIGQPGSGSAKVAVVNLPVASEKYLKTASYQKRLQVKIQ